MRLPWFQYSQHHPFSENIFWLIEISDSTLSKDLNEKQRIYAQAGILEYWVVDVKAKKVFIHILHHMIIAKIIVCNTYYSDFQVNRPHRRGLALLNPYMKMWFK